MFCPVCESEFGVGIETCPDDGTQLVAKLTPENTVHDHSQARFVPLHTFGSPAEAEMVNDIFKQNGVRSAVQSGGNDALSPLLSTVSNGATILVDERDYDNALELYQSFFGDDPTPLTGTTIEEDLELEGSDESSGREEPER
ncbi:MAG: putative prokaryotic signal transducing protein [Blastocatellia bacterium]|nr:putative prokaryotic signal transducing protein [Blastocatellia bacterium]